MNQKICQVSWTFAILFMSGQALAADAVNISKIAGLDPTTGGLMAQTPIKFYFHYEVGAENVIAIGNPFHFISSDGATWQPLTAQPTAPLTMIFDFISEFLMFGVDGSGADTIDFYQVSLNSTGLPPGFNSDLFLIETRIAEEQIGKHLCIDTCNRGGNEFLWATISGGLHPAWGGPYCFEIVDCCVGNRGDVNGDGVGPNIVDLARLVDYLFRGKPAPSCRLEADVNGDGMPYNLIDLNFIVNYIHRGGPGGRPCPSN